MNNDSAMPGREMSEAQVAKYLGVTVPDVLDLEKKELLHSTKLVGEVRFFAADEIEPIKVRKGLTLSQQAEQIEAQLQRETLSTISLTKKVLLTAGTGIGVYLLLVGVLAVLFLRKPTPTSDFFGYYYRINTSNQPQAVNLGEENSKVLAAATGPADTIYQASVLADFLRPAADAALVAVKAINTQTYDQVVIPPNSNAIETLNTGVAPVVIPGPQGPAGLPGLTGPTGPSGPSGSTDGLTNSNLSGSAGITNANLANPSVTVNTAGPLTGGGTLSLGSSLTLDCPTCSSGSSVVDSLDGLTGALTISNTSGSGTNLTISGLTAGNLSAGDFSSVVNSGTYSIDISGNSATATNATNATNFTGSLSGDVTGMQGSTVVGAINGVPLGSTTPTAGNLLIGSGSQWVTQGLSGDGTLTGGGVLALKNTGTAGTYGSALDIPVFTTDAQGRITSVTPTTIAGLTNSNLSGSAGITNANLANSSITINSTGILTGGAIIPLGGSVTLDATEADTLGSVTARGATTGTALTLSNAANNITVGTLTATGGTIDGISIGAGTPSTGAFTILSSTGTTSLGNNSSTVVIDGTNFDLDTSGVVTLKGGQASDITTPAATGLTINSGTTGAINIGTDTNDKNITIGFNGAGPGQKNIILGGTFGTSTTSILGGSGGIIIGDRSTPAGKTISIGGNIFNASDTVKIATNGTSPDSISIGNSNAATTISLTGGTTWSISTAGTLTTTGDISTTGTGTITSTGLLSALSDLTVTKDINILQQSGGTPGFSSIRSNYNNLYLTNNKGKVVVEQSSDEDHALEIQEANFPWTGADLWFDGPSGASKGLFIASSPSAGDINMEIKGSPGTYGLKVLDNAGNAKITARSNGDLAVSGNITVGSGLTLTSDTVSSAGALNFTIGGASTWTLPNVVNALNFDSNTLSIDALNHRIGIGTNSPTSQLTIDNQTDNALENIRSGNSGSASALLFDNNDNGSVAFGLTGTTFGTDTSQSFLGITANNTTILKVDDGDTMTSNGLLIGTSGNAPVVLGTNGNAEITIDPSGNVGIGTSSPDQALTLADGATMDSLGVLNIAATTLNLNGGTGGVFVNGAATQTNGKLVLCIDSATNQLFFGASESGCNVSSEKNKHNIAGINLGLDAVNALRPVSYNYNSDNEPSLGFIAEEAQKVDERLVVRDANGVIQAIDPTQFIPILTKATQQISGYIGPASSGDLSGFIMGIHTEAPRDSVAIISAKINAGTQFLTDFIAARVTAIRGYFDEVFANKVHTNEICLKKSDGSEVCMNGDQLKELLPSVAPTATPSSSPVETPTASPATPTITPVESPSPSPTGAPTPAPEVSSSPSPTASPI